jgi:MFS family permease
LAILTSIFQFTCQTVSKQRRFLGFEIYGQRMLTLFVMLNTLIIIISMTFVNQLTSKWSERKSLTTGALLQGLGFAAAFLMNSFIPLILASIVMTIGEMILVPILAKSARRPDERGEDRDLLRLRDHYRSDRERSVWQSG